MKQTKSMSPGQTNLSLLLANSNQEDSFKNKYLTFFLDDGCYAVPILKIQEIISLLPITPVPHVPDAIVGLINLRGRVVSVMDLRAVLSIPISDVTSMTSIMVIKLQRGERFITIGGVVDRVASVYDFSPDTIDPPPSYSNQVDISQVKGMAKSDGRVVMILDVDKIIDGLMAETPGIE